MDRSVFHSALSKSRTQLEDLVALAQTQVESHTRTSKTGKVVQVQSYTRDVGDMSNTDLFKEYKELSAGKSGLEGTQQRNRLAQVVTEIRTRKEKGQWGHTRQSDATKAAQRVDKTDSGHSTKKDFEANRQVPKGKMTDEEYSQHVERVRSILKDPASQKYDTQRMHGIKDPETGKPIPGVYSPERTEQHKQIISDILEKHKNVPTEKKAIMSGGLGGAGKGFVLKKHADVDHSQFLTIDPDEMKQELIRRGMVPEIPGLLPMEHANFIHEESSDLANLLHQVAMSKGMNIILDTTMASVGSTEKKLNKFNDAGYTTDAVFVDVPLAVSLESALNRHRGGVDRFRSGTEDEGGEFGGRFVPPEYIQSAAPPEGSEYHSKNRAAFEEMKASGLFNRARVIDNSDRRKPEEGGSGPRLISDSAMDSPKKDPSKTSKRAMDKVRLSASVEHLIKLTHVN